MNAEPFEHIYNRIIDAELGLVAIVEIMRHASSHDEPVQMDKRNGCVGWIADRVTEQLAYISDYAEDQARRATGTRP